MMVCGTCTGKGYVVQVGPGHVDHLIVCRDCAGTGLRGTAGGRVPPPGPRPARALDRDHFDRLQDARAEHNSATGELISLADAHRRRREGEAGW